MFGARDAALCDRVAGMQVGPMGRDMEPAGFGTDQGVFVGLGRRQGAGGIQLGQFIFEHAFNIWIGADTPQRLGVSQSNGQHQIDPDNTCRPKADGVWTRSACDHSAIRRETDTYRTGSGATVMREPGHTAHGPCAPGPRSSEDRAAAF